MKDGLYAKGSSFNYMTYSDSSSVFWGYYFEARSWLTYQGFNQYYKKIIRDWEKMRGRFGKDLPSLAHSPLRGCVVEFTSDIPSIPMVVPLEDASKYRFEEVQGRANTIEVDCRDRISFFIKDKRTILKPYGEM